MGGAFFAFDPAVAVASGGELEAAGRAEHVAEAFLDLGAEPDDAAVGDGVFEAGVFAIGAVAVVALDEHDFFGDVHDLVGGAEAEDVGEARVGLDLVVRHAEAAADGDVEAEEFFAGLIGDGDEAEIVGVDVDVIARRDGDDGFKFARQVGRTVERLRVGFAAGDEFVGDPDFVIGARARGEVIADGFR